MKKENIYNLISDFLKGNASKAQEDSLKSFLDSYQDSDDEWKPEYGDRSEIKGRIYRNIQKKQKRKLALLNYAAAVVFIISGAFFLKKYMNFEKTVHHTDEIVIKLSDGSTKVIDVTSDEVVLESKAGVVGVQSKEKLTYAAQEDAVSEEELVYNELYVPYGKKFEIELSDGTQVTLNSGSSLKYPVQFIKNTPREVFLEGEAFFEVTKSKTNSFIVHSNSINTKVYGTAFNISSYANEAFQEIVLVEGSVGVYDVNNEDAQVMLNPNEKAKICKKEKRIRTRKVEVENYIAWKDNVLLFSDLEFEHILKKLERHYNVSIHNFNTDIAHHRYTGTFESETLTEVLHALSKIQHFSYTEKGDEIIIE